MNPKKVLALIVVAFCVYCGWLIAGSGLFDRCCAADDARSPQRGLVLLQSAVGPSGRPDPLVTNASKTEPTPLPPIEVLGGDMSKSTLGSLDKESDFKFELELDSRGASIRKATFTDFDNRDPKKPLPLEFLSPVRLPGGAEWLSLSNKEFSLIDYPINPLNLLNFSWRNLGVETNEDRSQTARFEVLITDANAPVLRILKTYRVLPGSYLLECSIALENLSEKAQNVQFDLGGPVGLGREAFRTDLRKVVGGFIDDRKTVISSRLDKKALTKAKNDEGRRLKPKKAGAGFRWAAAVNKYFAAIVVPKLTEDQSPCDWILGAFGTFYNPDGDRKNDSGDETVGLDLMVEQTKLDPAGRGDSTKTYDFQVYLGPKDKSRFDKNPLYRKLRFRETIDFLACCCPPAIINPLAFAILGIMKIMYAFIGNYGVVIIILVFLVRLMLHPITKKSQISMHKMSKLAPMTEEIKKKYANNQREMNKRLMELYREQGASPFTSMLPMMVQMPLWIALWSAVYTSIDLRGAAFLPFWITDLSMPDALWSFSSPITVPLFGWRIESLNLLPILMGVAFYLQQKLMPAQASAANPQMAQQQKMMMIMMPLLFPLMLYKAPSGVNLYIMASTFGSVIEQHVVRKHIREREEAESKGLVAVTSKTGGKVKKKKPKPFYRT